MRLLTGAAPAMLLCAATGAATQTTTYTYDVHGRLVSAQTANGSRTTHAYDAADNRTQIHRIAHNRAVTSPHDFDGDGHSDLAWRNQNGAFTTWRVTEDAGSYQTHPNAYVNNTVPSNWQSLSTIDFNGDGNSDLLWRHSVSGDFSIWNSTVTGFTENSHFNTTLRTDWVIRGVGDYDGDGRSDLFWRHTDGRYATWRSTGADFVQNVATGTVDPSWRIVGEGDFNGDGKVDIFWRNTNGSYSTWHSTGSWFVENVATGSVPIDWHMVGVGDFDGDAKADLLWRNDSGALRAWRSTGGGFIENVYADDSVPTSWKVDQIRDFNADGKADILWREDTGPFSVWQSTGNGFTPNVIFDTTVGTDWTLVTHRYEVV